MKIHDLAREVKQHTGLYHQDVFRVVKWTFRVITEQLKKGNEVHIIGFGKWEILVRKAREGVDPRPPHKRIKMPEVKTVKFRVGHTLKNEVKNS